VLAKWLFAKPEVLILDEPTRGIDVGAKFEIYTHHGRPRGAGKCVIMISSEMPELLGLCDPHLRDERRPVRRRIRGRRRVAGEIMRAIVTVVGEALMEEKLSAAPVATVENPRYAGFSQEQPARLRHADVARRDHGVLPVHDRRTLMQPLNLTNLVLQNSYNRHHALGMLLVIVGRPHRPVGRIGWSASSRDGGGA